MAYLSKVSRVCAGDLRTVLVSMAWLPLFSLGLRILGFGRLHAWVRRKPVPIKARIGLEKIKTIGAWVNFAAKRSPFPASCLSRSMLLEWLLRRRGVTSELRIGVSLERGTLRAHAWVEVDGVPVNDEPDIARQFASFDSLAPVASLHAP